MLAGQALHWFDPEQAAPEIARVLRPRGDRIRCHLGTAPETASGTFELPVRTIVRRTRRC